MLCKKKREGVGGLVGSVNGFGFGLVGIGIGVDGGGFCFGFVGIGFGFVGCLSSGLLDGIGIGFGGIGPISGIRPGGNVAGLSSGTISWIGLEAKR